MSSLEKAVQDFKEAVRSADTRSMERAGSRLVSKERTATRHEQQREIYRRYADSERTIQYYS